MENLWTMHIQFFKVLLSFRSCISFLVGWCTSKINRLFSIIITCSVFRSIFSTQTETTIWMILLLLKPLWFVFFHYHATEFVCLQMFCDDDFTNNSCYNWMVCRRLHITYTVGDPANKLPNDLNDCYLITFTLQGSSRFMMWLFSAGYSYWSFA